MKYDISVNSNNCSAPLNLFIKKKKKSICLAAPDLSCGMWHLHSLLQHVGSSSPTKNQTQAPCIGSSKSATGPQEKYLILLMSDSFISCICSNSGPKGIVLASPVEHEFLKQINDDDFTSYFE